MASSAEVFEPWVRALIGEAAMPARKIRPSRYSVTAYVATTKASSSQDAESSLERDFLTLLEYDRSIERFLVQPFSIEWRDGNRRKHRYTPDVIVKYSCLTMLEDPNARTTIFEVKPREVLKRDWAELRPKFRSAIGWALDHGCRFHLITEQEIRTPYLSNVRFLLGYRSIHLQGDSWLIGERQYALREALFRLKTSTPRELLQNISGDPMLQAEILPWLWNLINLQLIGVDLNRPLTMASPIWSVDTAERLGVAG